LIPGFVAFPIGAALLEEGAGYAQIAAFVSSLMVGVETLPWRSNTSIQVEQYVSLCSLCSL
jgi:hypothetical protein